MTSPPNRRPRVAVDARACLGSLTGIGVYTRAVMEGLAASGPFEMVAMAHAEPSDGAWMAAAGIPFEAQATPSGVAWQQWRLPRRLGDGDVDLFWSPLQTIPLRSPVPSVTTVHDLTPLLLPETHTLKVRWSQVPILGRALDAARRIIAVSAATADDLRRHFPAVAGKVRVIHNGVDPAFRPGTAEQIAAIRDELGAPGGYLLYAGTLEPRKNVALLLDAWEALRADDVGAPPLVLAGGDGWKSGRLLRRLDALRGRGVHRLGRVEHQRLVRLMQGASLFVYPSLHEGFGLPAVEAMACGVPVIVADTSSLPEVVGNAGVLVPPDDPGHLGGAIRHLLRERGLARELAARGIERAAGFRWERAVELHAEVFREALAEGNAA